MSQNVEVIGRANAAFRHADWTALADNLDPQALVRFCWRVILEEFFLEHEQALKAVGLAE